MSKISNNNIVSFPTTTELPYCPPKSLDEIKENIDLIRQVHVQQTLEILMESIFSQIYLAGFPVDNDDIPSQIEGAFIAESLRAVLLNLYDIHHPFQKLIKVSFNERKDGMLEIVDEINIWLKEENEKK